MQKFWQNGRLRQLFTLEGAEGCFKRKPLIALEFGDEWSVNDSRG